MGAEQARLSPIQEALDKRANAIRESIESAEKTRQEADELLSEYRARLKGGPRAGRRDHGPRSKGRRQRQVAGHRGGETRSREELLAAARRDIEAETRRSLERIRKEVADLTILTTEKVTRKSLSEDDQKKLVEEALAEVDFSILEGSRN